MSQHGIAAARLIPYGDGPYAPVTHKPNRRGAGEKPSRGTRRGRGQVMSRRTGVFAGQGCLYIER
jgi:hypothetical protein